MMEEKRIIKEKKTGEIGTRAENEEGGNQESKRERACRKKN